MADRILIKWKAASSKVGSNRGKGRARYGRHMTIPQTKDRQLFFFFFLLYKAAAHWMLEEGKRYDRNITLNNYRGHPRIKRQQADKRWGQNKRAERNSSKSLQVGDEWRAATLWWMSVRHQSWVLWLKLCLPLNSYVEVLIPSKHLSTYIYFGLESLQM